MKVYLRRTIEEYWTLELDDQVVNRLRATEPGLQNLDDDDQVATALFNYFRRYAAVLNDNSNHVLQNGAHLRRARIKDEGPEQIGMVSTDPNTVDEEAITKDGAAPERLWETDPEFGAADSIMIRIDPSDLPDT